MIAPSARLAALVLSLVPLACIRVPRSVAAEFCAQSPRQSHFARGNGPHKPKCCVPRRMSFAQSGSAVEGYRCEQ